MAATRTTASSASRTLSRLESVFIPFLISRQIFTGAGKVVTNAKGTAYSMSQRAEHIWEAISSATTRSRPIINTRDEPHADPEKFRRLHVIVGDSNMSEFATYLKVGTASVVLAMIEDDIVQLRDYAMASPINALARHLLRPLEQGAGQAHERARPHGARDPRGPLRAGREVRHVAGPARRSGRRR